MDIENNMGRSPKRAVDNTVLIEARPDEVKAARELSMSPKKKTQVGSVSPVRSPKKTPKLKLSNTQNKLQGAASTKKTPGELSKMVSNQAKKTRYMILSNEYKVIFLPEPWGSSWSLW